MAVYVYTAVAVGEGRLGPKRGTITADSPRQARDHLRAQGLSVRDIAEQTPRKGGRRLGEYLKRRQRSQVTGLFQELSTLLAAGIPLLQAMDTIARQHAGQFKQSIMLLRDHIAGGCSLAAAMEQQPALFDELAINIVHVGENSGKLEGALNRLVAFRRRAAGLTNRVANALIYPCIVMGIGLAVSIFLMTYVVPQLLSVLQDSGKELPRATLIVKGVSDFLLGWWWALLLAAAIAGMGVSVILRDERGLAAWHRWQLKIPVLGELIRKQSVARMAMVMATLLKSDVVFVRAVQIAQRTVHNRILRQALSRCEEAVYAGRDISSALEGTGAFPPVVIQVFAVGQASGRLEEMLENLANDYDTQVDLAATRLTTLLEPIMIILLAIVVGGIAFAVFLPILEAGNVL
jgi:type II secretory pathway component PulF